MAVFMGELKVKIGNNNSDIYGDRHGATWLGSMNENSTNFADSVLFQQVSASSPVHHATKPLRGHPSLKN